MAVRIPDFNAETTASLAVGFDLGTACTKPANTATVTAFWFRTRDFLMEWNASHNILSRDSGGTGGNNMYLRLSRDCTTLTALGSSGGSERLPLTTLAGLGYGKTYLVILAARNGWFHLIACEPGGTPLVVSVANTQLFSTAMTTVEMWESIASSPSSTPRPFYGPFEEFNFWYGAFPETAAGVPDSALIQSIASGTQDLATVHTLLTADGGTAPAHRARYRLGDETDIASLAGVAPALTPTNTSTPAGAVFRPFGPLRPGRITPAYTRDNVSQVVFATPGNPATATAQIRVEGGSYNGLPTMSRMQVRLLDESRAVVRDWIDLTTTAPVAGAGTWAASPGFTGVPMQASFLTRQFRAVDSGGAVIAGPTDGYSVSGAGFHLIGQAQSQLATTVLSANAYALPSGTRFLVALQNGNEPVAAIPELGEPEKLQTPYTMQSYMPRPVFNEGFGARLGPRMMAAEISAIYPGVPVQYTNLSLGGTALSAYSDHANPGTPGELAGRWNGMRVGFGIVQPYIQLFFGHSSGTSGYYAQLASVVAWSQAQFGTPVRYLHLPVSRYRGAGTGSNFTATANSRNGARQFVQDNPGLHWWAGSLANVFTALTSGAESASGSDPHSEGGLFGAGRIGSIIGQSLLMAVRAIPDVPLGITAVRAIGATAVIEFGPVNA